VRQELLRRSRRWRDQVQDLGDRFEQRVEGWLEEPPWQDSEPARRRVDGSSDDWSEQEAWDQRPPRRSAAVTDDDPWI
jgi:hypothetical protein